MAPSISTSTAQSRSHRHDIARILAAQFQPEGGEGACRSLFDGAAAGDRAGEVGEVEGAGGEERFGGGMIEDEVLEHVLRHAGGVERFGQTFADQQGLAGVFQTTALPAIRAGTMVLVAVRYG